MSRCKPSPGMQGAAAFFFLAASDGAAISAIAVTATAPTSRILRNRLHVEDPPRIVQTLKNYTGELVTRSLLAIGATVERRLSRAALRFAAKTSTTMKRSTERFLTTHTGSLPRPDDLIRMMYAKEEGVPVDRGGACRAGAHRGRRGRQETVRRRCRPRQRRRIVQAELRHLHQGPAQRLRRHRQHFRLSGPRRIPEARPAACSAIPVGRGARRRPATRRSACATRPRRGPMSTISRPRWRA